MMMLPHVISVAPNITFGETDSFRNMDARQMVMTTLNLSTGATRDTSPVCNAFYLDGGRYRHGHDRRTTGEDIHPV